MQLITKKKLEETVIRTLKATHEYLLKTLEVNNINNERLNNFEYYVKDLNSMRETKQWK